MASGTAAVAVLDRREMNRRLAGLSTAGRPSCDVLLVFIVMMFANPPPIRRNAAKGSGCSAMSKTLPEWDIWNDFFGNDSRHTETLQGPVPDLAAGGVD